MEKVIIFIRRYKKSFFGLLFLILAGLSYLLGSMIGYGFIENALTKRITALFVLYKPAQSFQGAYSHLNSENDLLRLSGYYFLLENHMINDDFIIERYKDESTEVNKRTLIWLLGFSKNKNDIIDFYNSIYKKSELRVQKEILRSVQHFGDEYLKVFILKQNISGEMLEGL